MGIAVSQGWSVSHMLLGGCRLGKQAFERGLENKQRLFKDLPWTNKAGWEKLVSKDEPLLGYGL